MEYKIVSADSHFDSTAIKELNDKINKLLKEGWHLQGGVSITCDSQYSKFVATQAMVKYPPHPTINIE